MLKHTLMVIICHSIIQNTFLFHSSSLTIVLLLHVAILWLKSFKWFLNIFLLSIIENVYLCFVLDYYVDGKITIHLSIYLWVHPRFSGWSVYLLTVQIVNTLKVSDFCKLYVHPSVVFLYEKTYFSKTFHPASTGLQLSNVYI